MAIHDVEIANAKAYQVDGPNATIVKQLPLRTECPTCTIDQAEQCPVCENDLPSFNYVECTGSLFMQFNFVDNYNANPLIPTNGWYEDWLPSITIVTPSGEIAVPSMNAIAKDWWVGSVNGKSIQTVEFDMAKICALLDGEKCFYLKIEKCDLVYQQTILQAARCQNEAPTYTSGFNIGDYIYDFVGMQLYQYDGTNWNPIVPANGTYVWCKTNNVYAFWDGLTYTLMDSIGELTTETSCSFCYTEVFKVATCEDLVTFETIFNDFDCLGYYYGEPDSWHGSDNVPFRNIFSVRGVLEPITFPIETIETDEGIDIEKTLHESYQLRTWGLLHSQAQRVANVFMGKEWYVENEQWENVSEVAKNNDQGETWWLDVVLTRELCTKTTDTCDTDI